MSYLTMLDADATNPWRKTYEVSPSIVWFFAGSYIWFHGKGVVDGVDIRYHMAGFCFFLSAWWSARAFVHIKKKTSLIGKGVEVWPSSKLFKKIKKRDGIWLGKGFDWTVDVSQKMYDLIKIGPEKFKLGAIQYFFLAHILRLNVPKDNAMGHHWIHGIDACNEKDFEISPDQWVGNTIVLGVPGSGKTFLMTLLAHQFSYKAEPTVVFDPKDDAGLRAKLAKIAAMTNRPFYSFRLTDPKNSVRINPIGNISSAQDVANRLGSLVPSSSGGADPFVAQAWLTLSTLSQALRFLATTPTIRAFKDLLDLGWEELSIKVFKKHLLSLPHIDAQNVESHLAERPSLEDQLSYLEGVYKTLDPKYRNEVCTSIVNQNKNPETWHLKMIAGLKPVLQQLSAGELGPLLSPDPYDDDDRTIVDTQQVIREGGILYVGLNSLSDRFTSSALASILLADYSGVAGRIYANEEDDHVCHLLLDECSELVDAGPSGAQGLLQLLNKGRGAGYRLVLFSQSLSDFSAGLGSKDKMFQMFGNTVNKIALRCTDPDTQEFFAKMFGKTTIKKGSYGVNTGSAGNDGDITSFSSGYRQQLTEADAERFSPEHLGSLPNMECLGIFGGGAVKKIRFPIVLPDKK